jgi:hypothetical protein
MMNTPATRLGFLLCGAILCNLCACRDSGLHTVTGKVTWNGNLLSQGDIILTPADGSGIPVAGKIVHGKFRLETPPGTYEVAIFATREIASADPQMGAVPREMYIPERFNDQTTLAATIGPDQSNYFEYPLTDEPPSQ